MLVVDQLRAEGQLITSTDLEAISPLAHGHVHAYGHHPFNLASRPEGFRPLRHPSRTPERKARTPNRV